MPRGIKAISDMKSDVMLAHIIDPKNNPLPAKMEEQYARVVSAARLLDEYPNDSHVIRLHLTKYRISRSCAREDIAYAKELFKSRNTFDWDFSFAWAIKDQLELIRLCRLRKDLKNWNAAKKVLIEMMGERPAVSEDPRRMEKNVFLIQVNNINGESIRVPLDAVRGLKQEDLQLLQESLQQPVDDAEAEEIFNS